jgi:hypothetical protein|uniref:PxGV-Torf96 protein n=1 Tax=Plutella xylostella granulovirus TaxID=98383 RepID=A0A142DWU1_9BBAC|nr:PxGV-Torf96 protein [Plutella xylostella granulovirus]
MLILFMDKLESRVESFKYYERNVDVRKLSLLGFYYSGHQDQIICAYCNLTLDRFTGDEDVQTDHRRFSPHCPIIYDCVSNFVNTKITVPYTVDSSFPQLYVDTKRDYNYMENRLQSYKNWPIVLQHLVFPLSLSGLYYTNVGDAVVCYVCNFCIKGWSVDDEPDQVHYLTNSRCELIKNIKLKRQSSVAPQAAMDVSHYENVLATAPTATTIDDTPDYYKLPQCLKCRCATISTVALPCFHFCLCVDCCLACVECPACHVHTTGVFRVNVPHKNLNVINHD